MIYRILFTHRKAGTAVWGAMLLLFILGLTTRSPGQTMIMPTGDVNEQLTLDIESHSGTPLVLEFVLKGPEGTVQYLGFDFESDGRRDLLIDEIHGEVVFRGIPFRKPGRYHTTVHLYTEEQRFTREFNIAFTDFIWGRDNFQFANDGKFEDATDFVTQSLLEWVEMRFGPVTQDQQVLLLSIMYDIYKGSIGRCYGFTGQQIYYINNSDLLPGENGCVYYVEESAPHLYKSMDFVQNDIVFSNFLSGKINITDAQDREGLLHELDIIKRSIELGEPIIMGYLSNRMHHSMVAYGYFENLFSKKLTLVAANNWERDQNNNTFSEDAENIVVDLKPKKPRLSWYDLTKKRFRYPKSIFAVQREQQYTLSRRELESLLAHTAADIIENDTAVVIVEKTETAYMVDEEDEKQGYSKPKYFRENQDIAFKKIDYNFIFEYAAEKEYRLVLKKRRINKETEEYKPVNLFAIIPADGSLHTVVMRDLPVEDDAELVFLVNRDGVHLH